jgi:membrane-associated phospholipid phosphatase
MSHRPTPAGTGGRRYAGWLRLAGQVLLIVLAALCYFVVRGLTQSDHEAADANARQLVSLQQTLGIDIEGRIQSAIIDHDSLVTLANWVYIYGHWPLIAAVLCLLYFRAPDRFRLLRNAMFISGAIGLVIFALYPVAPPRLGILEVVDTVTQRSESYRTLQPPGLINRYAAMPSLHFGWNMLVGIMLWNLTRNVAVRTFAVAMPALMAIAVVATANHYVVDVFAGGLVALTGLAIARTLPSDLRLLMRRRERSTA